MNEDRQRLALRVYYAALIRQKYNIPMASGSREDRRRADIRRQIAKVDRVHGKDSRRDLE